MAQLNVTSFQLPFAPLYSSQTSGALFTQSAMWRGEERQFQVQWHEDRVYFGLLDEKKTVWATLDACEENEAVACFEEALESRRYGVCFSRQWDVYRRNFGMRLQFIYAPDGTGLLREWSSRDWLFFAPQETRMWVLFPDLELPAESGQSVPISPSYGCCRAAIRCVEDELLMRRVSDEEIERLSFRSNSNREEFERVMRLLWNAGLLNSHNASSGHGTTSCGSYGNNLTGYFYTHCRWTGQKAMMDWLHAYFTPQGFEWRDTEWGTRRFRKLRAREPHLRAFFQPFGVWWKVLFANENQPTFHEQLEARFELREWLREKAPEHNIESWLSPQT